MRLEHDEIKFGMMEDFCDIIVRNMDLADTVSTVRTYIFQTEYPAAFKHFTIGYLKFLGDCFILSMARVIQAGLLAGLESEDSSETEYPQGH